MKPYWKRKKTVEEPITERPCEWEDCDGPGECKAPKSPGSLREYRWFCRPHAAQYNKQWNYFAQMSAEEAEKYRVDAVTGHRPTWKIGITPQQVERDITRKLFDLSGNSEAADRSQYPPELCRVTRQSLAEMELNFPLDKGTVKKQYKKLVKRYHHDAQSESNAEQAAERFRKISEAYRFLMQSSVIPS